MLQDAENILEVTDLEVSFGGTPVLHRIGFSMRRGERVAIVGQSGSGKSTAIGAILRLLPGSGRITDGSIVLGAGRTRGDVEDLAVASEPVMRTIRGQRVSLVPQDPMANLNPAMKIGPQVADALVASRRDLGPEGRLDRSEVKARAVALLSEAGIPDAGRRYGQYPHEFSGGMRQRVLIAIALAGEPELLIADEPTSALDVTVQRQILNHLQSLVDARGTSLLFITHDLGLAADRTDRIIVMSEGRIVEVGTPRQILLDPRQEYTRRPVAAAPSRAARPPPAPPAPTSEPEPGSGTVATFGAHAVGTPATGRAGDGRHAAGPGAPEGTPHGEGERTAPILVVDDLVKEFPLRGQRGGTVRAVNSVSFEVARGTTTAVVGESGSGKTTVARIILGLEQPSSGEALIDGESLVTARGTRRRALRRKVQPVFQDPYGSLDPTYSIERLIDEPLRIFKVGDRAGRRDRVAELLDQVALPRSVAQRRPNELSGGQRQRVAIARALALEPELLICDEAVSALDVLVQEQILALLADLQGRLGLSYLFITHDLSVVRQIAHSVVVMRSGDVAEYGSADEVYLRPRSDYTRELLGAIPGAGFAA
ncbi:ABC transporter ATP-binding protein [Arthrobacter sp. RIT-PI-e]|uniref:dipeptide ABC transporter ATP-binding protein n=1 Tax=Arthrobacter sp. RIT-PI-e TaxID=1681197 RepID=UPI0006767A50|nr:ABC transporter ATP-binding protein [Arthrobacter sp. RIT-PI-e]KNC19708.1 ABC transporter ATP-binding protein [Arthrobacter sp. RIT-PI-e]